jgi:hypothetical protein
MINHRRWDRVAVKLAVVITDAGGKEIAHATTTDVCEAGLGMDSPIGLQLGVTYSFLIDSIARQPYKGVIRWSTPNPNGTSCSLGVELASETREQTDAMRAAVGRWTQAVSKGLSPS